jgi:hypothetical protein
MEPRKPRKTEPNLDGDMHWGLDREDVRRHARRMRQAQAVGPLGKLVRVVAIVLVGVGAFLVTWNFSTLKEARLDFSKLTSVLSRDSTPPGARPGDEPGTEVVGDSSIAGGVSLPTSIKGDAPDGDANESAAPAAAESSPLQPAEPPGREPEAVATAAPEPAPAPPPPPPQPEKPPAPETIGFGLSVMSVSEADAGAAVLVLRDGGTRGLSFFTWWTSNGKATAGTDFARLDRRVERFGVGEQNRTLYVPIIGDRSVEGPENFYVHIAMGDSLTAEELAQIEVVINDDD